MTSPAKHLRLVKQEPERRKWKLRHTPQHLDERAYPSGHVWRCNRAHVETVLQARARVCWGEEIHV